MGAMGRYIDGLDDAGRDRLIEGQAWVPYAQWDGHGGGCLLGHANGVVHMNSREYIDTIREIARTTPPAAWLLAGRAAHAFNASFERFGAARLTRAIKLRAARRNRLSLPASSPSETAVEVG